MGTRRNAGNGVAGTRTKGDREMEFIANIADMEKAEEMKRFLDTLPEQAQPYMQGCIDMVRMLTASAASASIGPEERAS
jgi:hypothetical protein